MKKILFPFIILSILLAACAPQSAQTAIAQATTTAEAATAPAPTAVSATPTETGPKVGDKIIKDGITYTYMDVKSSDGKHEYLGYFGPIAVNIPTWDTSGTYAPSLNPDGNSVAKNPDGSTKWHNARNIAPVNVLVELGVLDGSSLSITHPPLPQPPPTQNPVFSSIVYTALLNNYFHTKMPNPTNDQSDLFNAKLDAGKITYTITDGANTWTFPVSPQSGATIYVINPKNATKENGFRSWADGKPGDPNTHTFDTAFWGVDSHGIIGMFASETPIPGLTKSEKMMFTLWHLAVGMNNSDVTNVGFNDPLFQQELQYADKPPYPQLKVSP